MAGGLFGVIIFLVILLFVFMPFVFSGIYCASIASVNLKLGYWGGVAGFFLGFGSLMYGVQILKRISMSLKKQGKGAWIIPFIVGVIVTCGIPFIIGAQYGGGVKDPNDLWSAAKAGKGFWIIFGALACSIPSYVVVLRLNWLQNIIEKVEYFVLNFGSLMKKGLKLLVP
jgi:hypothetical protein